MIFWTTWMFAIIGGLVCLGAAIDSFGVRRWGWLGSSYFCMASGVIGSMAAVPL